MTKLKVYHLAREWTSRDYHALLNLLDETSNVLLVAQGSLSAEGMSVLSQLRPSLVHESRGDAWPGTCLLAHTAVIYKFRATTQVAEVLRQSAESLWDWLSPDRPEDLAFLRSGDGRPWFASITHEHDAFFKLTERECAAVESAIGAGSLCSEGDDPFPDEHY